MMRSEVIIGVDVHKYSHTAVGINLYGEDVVHKTFSNNTIDSIITSLKQLEQTDTNIVIGLEDINGYGKKLNKELIDNGFCVYHIPSVLTERQRKKTTHKAKSDYLDAKGVAKATLLTHRALPQVTLTQKRNYAEAIRGIIDDREDLVSRQTELKNQLHVLLHEHFGDDYKKGKRNIFTKRLIGEYKQKCKLDKTYSTRRIERKLEELEYVQTLIKELEVEIRDLKDNRINALEAMNGCGKVTACKILGEIKDIRRFSKEGKLARYAGVAPREHSSSRSIRMYTDKGGNRRLNRAIHTIALSQIGNRGSEESKDYYAKKKHEGKSNLHSLRCLKRQIVREVYKILMSC